MLNIYLNIQYSFSLYINNIFFLNCLLYISFIFCLIIIIWKTECKKRLLEILLSDNLNLLSIICQSPLANETGSTLPKSILKLLMAYRSEDIEIFIVKLLSYKARMYRKYLKYKIYYIYNFISKLFFFFFIKLHNKI